MQSSKIKAPTTLKKAKITINIEQYSSLHLAVANSVKRSIRELFAYLKYKGKEQGRRRKSVNGRGGGAHR
jgi:hypothetical protein